MLLDLSFLFLFFTWISGCVGDIVENVEELSAAYDFVIIGAGTAGNVIANRLTEESSASVLVLEAGGSNKNNNNLVVPNFCTRNTLPNSPVDWNYTTVPVPGLNNRSVPFPRGFVLGGTSSVNYMFYTRGSSEDWDRYATITGDPGWSWNRLQPYIRKNERFTQPADHHNTAGQFDPEAHGFNGINTVSLTGFPWPTDGRVIQTTTEKPDRFPFNVDMNSGNELGIGYIQWTIKDGERSSSATSYLAENFLRRRNLQVLLNARVTKLLSDGKSFRDVEFTTRGSTFKVTAKKEIILSAGSINTPQLLMLSGIGDSSKLSSLGIKTIHHLPAVGKNLTDHPVLSLSWLVNSTETRDTVARNATLQAEELKQWNETRAGPLVDSVFTHIGWFRLAKNSSIFRRFSDPAAGPNSPHFELVPANGFIRPPIPPTGNFFLLPAVVVSPLSRGEVTLNSNDPLASPLINPNFLDSEFDMFTMKEAVKTARDFVSSAAWKDYIISATNNATTDAELEFFIRNSTMSVFHPVGTAGMSPKGANWGVVDPDLRVKGIEGIRVVDASVFPFVPAAHTQAPTYIVAERAADLIKAAWEGRKD